MADEFPFERDFGYLMPFLDKVAKAAAELPDATARAEAMRLASDEKARWARLKALLSGAPAAGAAEPLAKVKPGALRAPGVSIGAVKKDHFDLPPPPRERAWTIGSLRTTSEEPDTGR